MTVVENASNPADKEKDQRSKNAKIKREISSSRPTYWLARGKIALRLVHVVAAPPAAGASCLLTHWASQLSRGEILLPGHDNEKGWGATYYMQLGHDIARVEYPRLEAAGADMGQVFVTSRSDPYDLEDEIKDIENLKLLIVDSDNMVVDEESGVTEAGVIAKLNLLAKAHGFAAIWLSKLPTRRAEADRRLEALALLPEVSVLFTIEKRGQDRALRTLRNRIGVNDDLLSFRIAAREIDVENETAPVIEWLTAQNEPSVVVHYTEIEKCIGWVRQNAQRGMRSTSLYELAFQLHGFSESTVKRALEPAGFKSCMVTGTDRQRFAILLYLFDDPKSVADGSLFKIDDEDCRRFTFYLTT